MLSKSTANKPDSRFARWGDKVLTTDEITRYKRGNIAIVSAALAIYGTAFLGALVFPAHASQHETNPTSTTPDSALEAQVSVIEAVLPSPTGPLDGSHLVVSKICGDPSVIIQLQTVRSQSEYTNAYHEAQRCESLSLPESRRMSAEFTNPPLEPGQVLIDVTNAPADSDAFMRLLPGCDISRALANSTDQISFSPHLSRLQVMLDMVQCDNVIG